MPDIIIRRYCIRICAGHFWPPNFFLTFVRSLLYTLKLFILVFNFSVNVRGWVPLYCLCSLSNDIVRVIHERGGGGHVDGKTFFESVRAKLF